MKSRHDDKNVRHWEHRKEKNWKKFQFNQPYAKGLHVLRNQVLEKTNFDPAVLWQWGTMQAMALITVLKAAEEKFGSDGQKLVLDSLWRVGYDVGRQITEGTEIPEDMTASEWISFYATVINRIAYASLETPSIQSESKVMFHIDWCPHQDHYKAFDCRVQRYFVQGMIDAAKDFCKSQGRDQAWDVEFKTTIPSGSETCLFEMEKGDLEKSRKWAEFTKMIEEKALDLAKKRAQQRTDSPEK
jgi:hypothetical protein